MKRIGAAALAALVMAGPLSVGAAHAQTRYDLAEARRDVRDERPDWRRDRDNGFYLGGRFYYGEPSWAQMQRRDYRPAWREWRRGDRLPYYARAHYREVDWRRERLRRPPQGYHYVRDDRGEILLVGIATGVILSILLSN